MPTRMWWCWILLGVFLSAHALTRHAAFNLHANITRAVALPGIAPTTGRHAFVRNLETFALRLPSTGWAIYDQDTQSWDQLSAALATSPRDVARVSIVIERQRTGLWLPTRDLTSITVRPRSMAETITETGATIDALSDADKTTIRDLVARDASLLTDVSDPDRVTLVHADVRRRDAIPAGYILNTVVIAIAIAWLYSWRWIPDHLRRRRNLNRDRTLAARRCPACGYDISAQQQAGLPTCPECGGDITPPPRSA